jgi:cold shock CspA family protein
MSTTATSETIYQGRVKWFNNKAGYGFVTIIDGVDAGDKIGTDIFAHHSSINVADEQYKYLVQGEYIEFSLSSVDTTADYKFQASSIQGIKGGKLLCETRNEIRAAMPQSRNTNTRQSSRSRGGGPRADQDNSEWVMANEKPKMSRTDSTNVSNNVGDNM